MDTTQTTETTTIPVEDMKVGYRYWAVRHGYESNWTIKSIETREADVQVERNGEIVTPVLVIVTRRDSVSQTLEQGDRIAIMGPFKGEPVE